MLKYTKAAVTLVKDNLKLYAKIFKYSSLIFSLAFYIYSICTDTGNFIVNIILISLLGAYLAFETITFNRNIIFIKKVVYKGVKWVKLVLKAFTISTTIYSIYLTSTHVNAVTIILTTLMIMMFIIQLIIEIVSLIVEHNIDYVLQAIHQDIEDMKKPVNNIKNVFRKMVGEEVIPEPKKSKKILKLEKRINKTKD